MTATVERHRAAFDQAIAHLKADLNTIRSNRAHPSLVEDVKVQVYGSEMRVKEVASVTVPEPRTIQVQPWDQSILKDLERGITAGTDGLSVANDGATLRLTLPPLTAESRQALLKVLHQKLEAGRVQLRQVRERVREEVVAAERAKEITEDDRYRAQEDLDELVKRYVEQVASLGAKKEEEITTV